MAGKSDGSGGYYFCGVFFVAVFAIPTLGVYPGLLAGATWSVSVPLYILHSVWVALRAHSG